ncbi:MAG: restriction endonuclease subunit S [Kiritimatiellae bacterium]|nr:restriction endonuclease subunit S [Kiritimatiellia bacterium]
MGALAASFKGKLPTTTTEKPTARSRPYLLMEGLRGGSHVFTEDTHLPSVTETDTVVIADGSKSGFAVRGVAGVVGSTLLGFRARNGVDASFLYHLLASLFQYLNSTTTGTAIPHLDQDLLLRLPIGLPPTVDEQAAIVRILDAVDTAIERTRMAAERAWVVGRSLIANLLRCGIGCDGRTRDRKTEPASFVRTAAGSLPSAWRLSSVADEFDFQNGFTLNAERRNGGRKRPYLRVANVQRDAVSLDDVHELDAGDAEFEPRKLELNDLLVVEGHADRMQIGRCACVAEEAVGMTFQNHLFRLRTHGDVSAAFGCLWLNSQYAQRYWNARCATSSGLNTINQRMLKRMLVPVVPPEEQDAIVRLAGAAKSKVAALASKEAALRDLKRALMDDLLSGRVRVDATRIGGAA